MRWWILVLFLAACQQSSDEDVETATNCTPDQFTDEVRYTDVASIFESNCTSCHSGSNPEGGLLLETYDDVLSEVVPGSLNSSEVYSRITTDGSGRMPPSGLLPTDDQDAIRDWILSCAEE